MNPQPQTPLGRLIEERKQAQDPPLTNTDIARRMGMSRQRVRQIINDSIEDFLPTETVRSLARAIRVPLPEVVEVMLETIGLPMPSAQGGDSGEAAIMGNPKLDDAAKFRMLQSTRRIRGEVQNLLDYMIEEAERGSVEGFAAGFDVGRRRTTSHMKVVRGESGDREQS